VNDGELTLREGRPSDLRPAFEVYARAMLETASRLGVPPDGAGLEAGQVERSWQLARPLLEFLAAQEGTRCVLCEDGDRMVGYARVVRFGRMEHLTELAVLPEYQGRGIARRLIERCWPGAPTQEVGRLALAPGSVVDLNLYMAFGAMPATGQWSLQQPTERFLERRSHEIDRAEAAVHMLSAGRAVDEWKRLEPLAIGHDRPLLHEFFGRERTCLAVMGDDGRASALCWVSPAGEIGPGVGSQAQDLVSVVLAALDRVAKVQEPERLSVFCTTDSWWLLHRLEAVGFRACWPGWVMCSEPLPGLDRYVPTRPVLVL
jgi:GNAT superfamily N-acetyltransferase